jgi:hypothetical protein
VLSSPESLAQALDDLYAQNQTDKRRTKPGKPGFREQARHPESQMALDNSPVGPVGLEPTTNGLNAPSDDPGDQGEPTESQ